MIYTLRPVDEDGDIRPVYAASELISGAEAVVVYIRQRLRLYAGEWWEDSSDGNRILDMLQAGRLSEADAPSVSSYLSSYILDTPGVVSLEDVSITLSDRTLSYSCTVITEYGSAYLSISQMDLFQ